ncbi:MAG: hypothetical protein Q7S19_01400 [bacterium]|nr:hypothetical protein [bacterium]
MVKKNKYLIHPSDFAGRFIMHAAWYILNNPNKKEEAKILEKMIKKIRSGKRKLKKPLTVNEVLNFGICSECKKRRKVIQFEEGKKFCKRCGDKFFCSGGL